MNSLSWRLLSAGCSIAVLGFTVNCGGKSAPAAPTPGPGATTTPVVAATIAAPALLDPTGGRTLDTRVPTLKVTNAATTGAAGAVKYRFEISELDTFPQEDRFTIIQDDVEQGGGETSWRPEKELRPGFTYFWRVRAKAASVSTPGEWSGVGKFTTANVGHCLPGPDLYDPLTEGRSLCGSVVGGHFIPGQGWQADRDSDGINFDLPTCTNCTVEFDVTNFGKKEGEFVQKDVKWITMGDAATFNDFNAFRNHPWKMHLEQRSDGDGTGMKLIWRNGAAGDDEPGDHTGKADPAVNWRGNIVYHFRLTWSPGGFEVYVGETQPDGSVINNNRWFADGFGGNPYAPGNFRVSIGCYPRSETMFGSAIWRNMKITKN